MHPLKDLSEYILLGCHQILKALLCGPLNINDLEQLGGSRLRLALLCLKRLIVRETIIPAIITRYRLTPAGRAYFLAEQERRMREATPSPRPRPIISA